jgi:hypothetical protein
MSAEIAAMSTEANDAQNIKKSATWVDNWLPVPCQLHWALRACATEKGQFLYATDQSSLLVNPVNTILTKNTMIIQVMIVDYKLTYPNGTATAFLINGFHTSQGAKLAR